MKKIGLVFFCLAAVLSGCGATGEQPLLETITYSNLAADSVQAELAEVMREAGIPEARQRVFFDHVSQFNNAVSAESLVNGFEQSEVMERRYDPYAMQEEWTAKYPLFLGYNCRITAFGLFRDFVDIPLDAEIRNDMVLLDIAALEEDPSALTDRDDLARFQALYSTVPAEQSQDPATHAETLRRDWLDRGIAFDDHSEARLITVVFHETWEDESFLFIGHVGILFPVSEDELYFVEKIAFQEPYQLTKFKNRTELNDYLMLKYDVDTDQPTAPPFIMENDLLLKEYRRCAAS